MGLVTQRKSKPFGKGDRWGLNPQPLEPQSRALPIELRSPQVLLHTVSIANPLSIVNRYFDFRRMRFHEL